MGADSAGRWHGHRPTKESSLPLSVLHEANKGSWIIGRLFHHATRVMRVMRRLLACADYIDFRGAAIAFTVNWCNPAIYGERDIAGRFKESAVAAGVDDIECRGSLYQFFRCGDRDNCWIGNRVSERRGHLRLDDGNDHNVAISVDRDHSPKPNGGSFSGFRPILRDRPL